MIEYYILLSVSFINDDGVEIKSTMELHLKKSKSLNGKDVYDSVIELACNEAGTNDFFVYFYKILSEVEI